MKSKEAVSKSLFYVLCFLGLAAVIIGNLALSPLNPKNLVVKVESLYNTIFLYKVPPNQYTLTFDYRSAKYIESVANIDDPLELALTYTQRMTVGAVYPAELKKMLMIGMGGGSVPWYMHHYLPEMQVTSVELDPEIVKIATQYMGVKDEPNHRIVTTDGRVFFSKDHEKYDLIMVDAYRGPFVPFHLLTREYYELLESRLTPGGAVVQNIEATTMLFDSAVATLRSVFDNVDFYDKKDNIIAVAYNGKKLTTGELTERAKALDAKYNFRYNLAAMVPNRYEIEVSPNAKPLTDDFAPVDSLKAIEVHNRRWN